MLSGHITPQDLLADRRRSAARRRRAALVLVALLVAGAAAAPRALAAAPYVLHADVDYDLGSPVSPAAHNRLDLFVPRGPALRPRRPSSQRRPVVVYVHGGGWQAGDKRRVGHKARLFTSAGYLFASVNYRLSPSVRGLPAPDRVRFPDHPHDVGEALGWLTRNVRRFGGDPDRLVLVGHSAGAHLASLVGVDPSFGSAYGVPARAVRGVVSLDTATFDVAAKADPARNRRPQLFWNAFGTPREEAADPRWASASPISLADRGDPAFLLVTQRRPSRVAENRAMLRALGNRRSDSLVSVPLDHAGINRMLGSPRDTTRETAAVMAFVGALVGRAR
jgi:arylformamidase